MHLEMLLFLVIAEFVLLTASTKNTATNPVPQPAPPGPNHDKWMYYHSVLVPTIIFVLDALTNANSRKRHLHFNLIGSRGDKVDLVYIGVAYS